ncbi:MAG: transcriptional repressor LexA, partial [Chlamydiales bacterium]
MLTEKQQQVLEYIDGYLSTYKYAPSYREIRNHFGFSSLGSVYNYIRTLKKKGVIEGKGRRALSLPKESTNLMMDLPLIGELEGGKKITMFSQVKMVAIPYCLATAPCYLLQIKGAALIDEGLISGDLLIVDPRAQVEEGEMVIVLIDGKAFVRRYHLAHPFLHLRSATQEKAPMIVRSEHLSVIGAVLGMLRSYSSLVAQK